MDFFVRLVPPRTTFAQDISAEEQEIMQRHGAFWTDLVHKRIGVIEAKSELALRALLEHDPAINLIHYEIHRMRAVHAGQ